MLVTHAGGETKREERGGVLGVNKGRRGEGALNGKPAVLLQALAINGVAYSQSKALYIMAYKEQPYFLSFKRNGRPL